MSAGSYKSVSASTKREVDLHSGIFDNTQVTAVTEGNILFIVIRIGGIVGDNRDILTGVIEGDILITAFK